MNFIPPPWLGISVVAASWGPLVVGLLAGGGGIAAFLGRKRLDDLNRKRQTCASALADALLWIEAPYRIRRRTPGDPAGREELVRWLNDLQHKLNVHQAWLEIEVPGAAGAYGALTGCIKAAAAPVIQESWRSSGAECDADMNVGQLITGDGLISTRREFVEAARRSLRFWSILK